MNTMEVLAKHAIKATKARISIYNMISSTSNGLSAEDLYKSCQDKGLNINLSTVYRTLEIFEAKDIIEKYDIGDGCYKFSIKNHSHKHILECSICHKEVELTCPMKQIEELVKSETGFVSVDHQLVMKGICKECGKK